MKGLPFIIAGLVACGGTPAAASRPAQAQPNSQPSKPAPSKSPPVIAVPDDARDMGEFFLLVDVNKDQVVTRAEFDAFFAQAQQQAQAEGTPDADAEAGLATYFALMDADGDGRVTRAEFDTFNANMAAQDGSGD
jgi:hypothetical protein